MSTMEYSELDDKRQLLVIRYLYGELDQQQLLQFEQQLQTDAPLRALLEEEQQLQQSFPLGTQPKISASRVQGNQWVLQKKLLRLSRRRASLTGFFRDLARKPTTLIIQLSAMAATFLLGLLVAQQGAVPAVNGNFNSADNPGLPAATVSPLALVSEDDYDIYQLQINNYDALNGEVDLSFSLVSETQLHGNITDPNISGLIAAALQNDIDSAARIQAIEVLQPVASQQQVIDAMMYLLRNDRNPGVRYQAVELLVHLADQEKVRDSLRLALSQDVNPGVRLEAFNALVNYLDEDTLGILRQRIASDSNSYIREQSQFLVESAELNAPI